MSGELGSIERGALAVARRLCRLLGPLDTPDPASALKALVAELGWSLPDPMPPALVALREPIASLSRVVEHTEQVLASNSSDLALAAAGLELAAAVANISAGLAALPGQVAGQLSPAFVAATDLPNRVVPRLVSKLIVEGIQAAFPVASRVLRLLGVIEQTALPEDPAKFQPAFTYKALHWDRIPLWLSNPTVALQQAYGWGVGAVDLEPLYEALASLSVALGFPGTYDFPSPGMLQAISPGADAKRAERSFEFTLIDYESLKVAAIVTGLPVAGPADKQGLALGLVTAGNLDKLRIELIEDVAIELGVALDAAAAVVAVLKPGEAPRLIANYDGGATPASGSITARLVHQRPPAADPISILALPGGSGISARGLFVDGGLARGSKGQIDPRVAIGITGGRLSIALGAADGFLAKLLPAKGVDLDFDLTVGWSHELGLYVEGTAGLHLALAQHLELGPVELTWLYVDIDVDSGAIRLSTSISARGALGPITALVDRIGIAAVVTFPAHGGNLAVANVGFDFVPPKGVGLSIDVGAVRGGGYLFIDSQRGEYAGALELALFDVVTISAVGIITTKMPDGTEGFSLLVIMSVEFGSGVQLGFGFTLSAVGGLVGLNRTMNLRALAEGIRTGAIESVMFPKNIIANAAKIISDLRTFFPPREGTFLIGPMAKIGWGTPTLASVSLGIIVEIPGNIAIVGIVKVAIPGDAVPLIVLQVNFIGAIELDKKRIWFFASLFESRIVFITIDGELGLLVAYGDDANFVLSVGGFHPRFAPPPLPFPSPKRISVGLLNSPLSRMRIEGYFAVTSNTVQFGAKVEMFFGLDILNVQGHLAFDALFQFSPFSFVIEISASLSVKVFGAGVFSVSIRGTLEGPAPWHVKGHGSISLLFWDVDVEFETTWGEANNPDLPPIAVMPIITGELAKPENWRALLPTGSNLLVSLRSMPEQEASMILHPIGVLRVSQRALPLELTLDKVGAQKPNDFTRLSIAVVDGGLTRKDDAFEKFAPAQFQTMTDAEKLSRPAFAPERSGLDLSAGDKDVRSFRMVRRLVRYEMVVLDSNYKRFAQPFSSFLGILFQFFLNGASVTKCGLSQAVAKQLVPFDDKIVVHTETYTVANVADNTVFGAGATTFHSEASARDFMNAHIAANALLATALHVIPTFEVAT